MYNISPPKYQSNKDNRLRYIDATRGFAIFLVVLGHVLNIGMNNYDENHFLHRLIYSFHMPLFFFLSGFVSYKPLEKWSFLFFIDYIKRKSVQLLLPTYLFFVTATVINSGDVLSCFYNTGVNKYWFGQALFQMLVVYGIISALCNRFSSRLFIPLLFMACLTRCLCFFVDHEPIFYRVFVLRETFMNMYFFIFGLLVSKYKNIFAWIFCNERVRGIAIFTFIVCMIYIYQPYAYGLLVKLSDQFLLRVSGVIFVFSLFIKTGQYWNGNQFIARLSNFIGKRTFDIYLIHYFFIPDLSFVFPYLNCKQEIALEILLALSVSIVIMAFCLIVSFVLRSNRLTGLCILGIIKK